MVAARAVTVMGEALVGVGAVVVAVTLIYLAVQTHLNKRALEAAVVSNIQSSWSQSHQSIINSEEVALLNEKGHRDPESLTKGESLRYFMLVRDTTNAYYGMFLQYRNGLIDEHHLHHRNEQ